MTLPIPTKDSPILPWAAAVTAQLNGTVPPGVNGALAHEGPGGTGYEPIVGNERTVVPENPVPFEIIWSYDEEEPTWIVYLPYGSFEAADESVLAAWQTFESGLTQAEYGDDWYVIPNGAALTGTLYLIVKTDTSSSGDDSVVISMGTTPGGDIANIPLAELSEDDTERHYADDLWVGSVYLAASSNTPAVDDISIEDQHDEPTSGSAGETETVRELAIKGWHTTNAGGGTAATVVGDIGLPDLASSTGDEEAVQRAYGKGSPVRYRKVGRVDKSKILSTIEKTGGGTGEDTTVTVTDLAGNETEITIPAATSPVSPGDGKLLLKIGDASEVDTGFSANCADDKILELPEIPSPVKWPSGGLVFVGDVRYNVSSHQLQKRMDTWNPATGVVAPGNWEMIVGGQCTPHSDEHPSSE